MARDVRDASRGWYEGALADDAALRMYARFSQAAARFNTAVLRLKPEASVAEIKASVADLRGRELPGMANPAVMRVLVRNFHLTPSGKSSVPHPLLSSVKLSTYRVIGRKPCGTPISSLLTPHTRIPRTGGCTGFV